jgi:hypothetical protein
MIEPIVLGTEFLSNSGFSQKIIGREELQLISKKSLMKF